MHALLFGHELSTTQITHQFLGFLGHTDHIEANTSHDLVALVDAQEPDVVLVGPDWLMHDYLSLIPAVQRLRQERPNQRIIFLNVGLPRFAIDQDATMKAMTTLGVPIYTIMCEEDDYEGLVALATTNWPGFCPETARGYTAHDFRR